MPHSKPQTPHGAAKRVWLVLLMVTMAMAWFAQRSINTYWLQTYQQKSPLQRLDKYRWWRAGAELYALTESGYRAVLTRVGWWYAQMAESGDGDGSAQDNTPSIDAHRADALEIRSQLAQDQSAQAQLTQNQFTQHQSEPPPIHPSVQDQPVHEDRRTQDVRNASDVLPQTVIVLPREPAGGHQQPATDGQAAVSPPLSVPPSDVVDDVVDVAEHGDIAEEPIVLEALASPALALLSDACVSEDGTQKPTLYPGEKVLFVGDSLMQSLAPHLRRRLKSDYDIDSLNVSKPSTGLAYAGFFDWPAKVEELLAAHPDVAVMVVFFGANDAQAFIDPDDARKKPLAFRSERWAEVYRQRIVRILDAADAAGVEVVWLGLPRMRATSYQEKMAYINGLFDENVAGRALWLPIAALLGDETYQDSATVGGKTVRLRRKDGIHLSREGDALVADYLWSHLCYVSE